MRIASISAFLAGAVGLLMAADAPPPVFKDIQVRGEVRVTPVGFVVSGKSAVVALGGSAAESQRLTAEVVLAPSGLPVAVVVGPSDWSDITKPAAGRVNIGR